MDLVRIKNTGSQPLDLRHDVHGDVSIEPGRDKIVQAGVALAAFGHPSVKNVGNLKHRDDEYKRLRVYWGFYAGLSDEAEWAETGPSFEAYDLDDNRIHFILDDPTGEKGNPATLSTSDDATLQERVATLEAQLQQAIGALSRQNEASTPTVPGTGTQDADDADDTDAKPKSRKKPAPSSAPVETQESRNEQRDEIPKPAADAPEATTDKPRSARVGSRTK